MPKAFAERQQAITDDEVREAVQFFKFEHLPKDLQAVSKPFYELAYRVATELPDNPERVMTLRKLVEAKDCAVRTLLYGR